MNDREPTDLELEQLALGEPSTLDRNDPSVRKRLEKIAASNEAILRAYPPERLSAQIQRRAERTKTRRRALVVSFASAAIVLVIATFALSPLLTDEQTERTKGLEPHVVAWRRTASEPEPLLAGALVNQGDTVQLAYVSAGARYGVIVSLDGRGQSTLHFPTDAAQSTRLQAANGAVLLDEAYELDDAPLFERFFFVTSNEPLDAAGVIEATQKLAAARDGGRTGVPIVSGKTRIMSFMLLKDSK